MTDLPQFDLPYAFGSPAGSGVIRTAPEDFRVDEITVVEPAGEGEHQLLHIEKRDTNTDWVAGLLARHAGVPRQDVSYAGLKDRHAVTTQWFSVRLAGRQPPDWQALESAELKILQLAQHNRKLKIGALKGNRFTLRIREFEGDAERLAEVLARIAQQGMPNYFGEQRFGADNGNLASARAMFNGELKRVKKNKRGFYLSAVRSMLFNRVLAERVAADSWETPLAGERLMLDGSRSSFLAETIDDEIQQRHREYDVHTSGPLWGRGGVMVAGEVAELEQRALEGLDYWCEGLEQFGLKMERRPLRVKVADLAWSLEDDLLQLSFILPKGCFATTLLRECLDYRQPERSSPLRDSRT